MSERTNPNPERNKQNATYPPAHRFLSGRRARARLPEALQAAVRGQDQHQLDRQLDRAGPQAGGRRYRDPLDPGVLAPDQRGPDRARPEQVQDPERRWLQAPRTGGLRQPADLLRPARGPGRGTAGPDQLPRHRGQRDRQEDRPSGRGEACLRLPGPDREERPDRQVRAERAGSEGDPVGVEPAHHPLDLRVQGRAYKKPLKRIGPKRWGIMNKIHYAGQKKLTCTDTGTNLAGPTQARILHNANPMPARPVRSEKLSR